MTEAGVEDRTDTAEAALLARLRSGDERAFETLVERLYPTMLAVARHHVSSRAVAEEVVQEAWLGVLKGLDRFEGRSSLKTWILRILVNTGDTITKDQPVLELETDKATIEVPSDQDGTITEIKVKQGDKVKVGQVVLTLENGS